MEGDYELGLLLRFEYESCLIWWMAQAGGTPVERTSRSDSVRKSIEQGQWRRVGYAVMEPQVRLASGGFSREGGMRRWCGGHGVRWRRGEGLVRGQPVSC